jgi:hypothetical membrane protein
LTDIDKLEQRGLFWISGLTGVGLIALGMLISAFAYTGRLGEAFNPLNHFVSELGEIGVSPLAVAFNSGLLLGGLCMVVSVFGLAWRIGGRWGILIGLAGLACGISGALVGAFPMNNILPHVFWAMNFFNFGLGVMILFSLAVLYGRRGLPKWLALPGLLPILAFASFVFFPQPFSQGEDPLAAATAYLATSRPPVWGMAIFEWLAVLSIMVWAVIIAVALRPRKSQAGQSPGAPASPKDGVG